MARKEPRISWKIEEYVHREKGPDWFWALGVIAIAGAAISIIFHDVLFAIFIILGAALLGFYANREPDIIEVGIAEDGITVRQIFYPYKKLKGFAIDEHELGSFLLVESDRMIMPLMSIPLPESINKDSLTELLITKLPHKDLKEPASHRLMEHLGF